MSNTNTVIRNFLIVQAPVTALVVNRIYYPKLPAGCTYPAISFISRPGIKANPHIPGIVSPSVGFKCWGGIDGSIVARNVYEALYDALQGVENSGRIISVEEELGGQDLEDPDITGLNYVLAYFVFKIRNE